jgi:hypothetical protein
VSARAIMSSITSCPLTSAVPPDLRNLMLQSRAGACDAHM